MVIVVDRAPTGFGERLRAVREAKGMTAMRLAELVGMSRQAMSRLEAGGHSPNWSTVLALAEALGCTPDAFLPESFPATPAVEATAAPPVVPAPSTPKMRSMGKRK